MKTVHRGSQIKVPPLLPPKRPTVFHKTRDSQAKRSRRGRVKKIGRPFFGLNVCVCCVKKSLEKRGGFLSEPMFVLFLLSRPGGGDMSQQRDEPMIFGTLPPCPPPPKNEMPPNGDFYYQNQERVCLRLPFVSFFVAFA